MAAMRAKAIGTDAYLNDWRRDVVAECDGDLEGEADKWLTQLYSDYDDARVDALVANKGYAKENSDA